ncbi:MAG: tRNA lysidine(34) synthetase TilS [Phycisphaeraceae bacterium]|nr:tRNA lysidine(34) synthetase TilS [Phycisphaeraceae bacterium]
MQTPILQKVIEFNERHALFSQDASLLVAVSGGGDSTALLSMLVTLEKQGHLKALVCVHFNHRLRAQADRDETFVKGLAHTWAVPFISETCDIKARAQTHHCSLETAGRQWRLERLISLAQKHQCTAIATGHHLDDNAETLIHRLSRGTGFRGLCGIRPFRVHHGMRVISPLLALTRQDIGAYLASQKQLWCEDATNQETTYTRNYIRQTLLPELSKQCPALTEKLADLSLKCHHLYAAEIEARADALLRSQVQVSEGAAVVTLSGLPQESNLVLVELVRQILTHLGIPLQKVTQYHYQSMMALMQAQASHVTLPGKGSAILDHGTVRIVRPPLTPERETNPMELTLPGLTRFGDLSFFTRITDVAHIDPQQRSNQSIEYLDLHQVTLPLQLRPRVPGDRFIPLGKTSPQKIGKFLSRADLRGVDRNHTVILCDGEQTILWVCPIRMSELAKVTNKTKEVLEISVKTEVLQTSRT